MLGMSEGRRMLGVLWGTNAPVQLSRRVSDPQPLTQTPERLQQPPAWCCVVL